MDQDAVLVERIQALKAIAGSIHEGAINTELIPEIGRILALPDDTECTTLTEREAIARQVREFEQVFDRLGYTLLNQIMPSTAVSPIFQVVQAADEFKTWLKRELGSSCEIGGKPITVDNHVYETLTRYSLSIGTPPVTAQMRNLLASIMFGRCATELKTFVETLDCDRACLLQLLEHLQSLVNTSSHYCTALEERQFLSDAAHFANFEGASLFNRVVITEAPERAIHLITNHVFDQLGEKSAVQVVEGVDPVDSALLKTMQSEPNRVFLAKVTRVPHSLFAGEKGEENAWKSVIGRLILVDVSLRARLSNTTIVFTLFPHVARTLKNVQTGFSGLPANTQLELRRILELFPTEQLTRIRKAIEHRLAALRQEGAFSVTLEEVRVNEWRSQSFFDSLALTKLKRMVAFLEEVSSCKDPGLIAQRLSRRLAGDWMRYFYADLPETYRPVVVPGGGRGALTLLGDFHRQKVRQEVERFSKEHLSSCIQRLEKIKESLQIPTASSDEIEAAIRQSKLQSRAPSQWQIAESPLANRSDYQARTLFDRVAQTASRLTRVAEQTLDHLAFGNFVGPAAAVVKRTMEKTGFSAFHNHWETNVGEQIGKVERGLREFIVPFQEMVRVVKRTMDDIRSENDPVAIGDIDAVLQVICRGKFYPILILPEMCWSYGDVFPAKQYPRNNTMFIPINDSYEIDSQELLKRIEELRYRYRSFPEIFQLTCQSMLLVINSPHNPTGIAYRRETILRLLQIAAEYGITVLDDNSYHKLYTRRWKEREGEDCVAQLYEKYRPHWNASVRIMTAGATTKGLQGSGDRTGLVYSNDQEVTDFVSKQCSQPHLMSLFVTRQKLESGLAAKRSIRILEQISSRLLEPQNFQELWEKLRAVLEGMLKDAGQYDFTVVVFETLLQGYEELLRLQQRGATVAHICGQLSSLVQRLRSLQLEVCLCEDVEQRLEQVHRARQAVFPNADHIDPQGAFYVCIRLCPKGNDQGILDFLKAISRFRKVDVTLAGKGFVRLSLGGTLSGTKKGYEHFGKVIENYLYLLKKYWVRYEEAGRNPDCLERIFNTKEIENPDGVKKIEEHTLLELALEDLLPIVQEHPFEKKAIGQIVSPAERGMVYCIEEGKSVADKIIIESCGCETVEEMLQSRPFRVIYRRLLRRVYRQHPELSELSFGKVDNQYGALACLAAYRDRQLINNVLRDLVKKVYQAWHGPNTIKVLVTRLQVDQHREKVATLHGIHRQINDLIHEFILAFEISVTESSTTFEIGYELLEGLEPNNQMPAYLAKIIKNCAFCGASAPLNPAPNFVTGAVKRISDYRYGFTRRDGDPQSKPAKPGLEYFRYRLEDFAAMTCFSDYVCKAEQVGPFKILVVIHKSCIHLINDELRLFPQLEEVQLRENLNRVVWDGVMFFGIPARFLGDSYKTGYILDQNADGSLLPTAWVAREDATDYVGFFKKTLLTLHNELVKAKGGMPVHGAMITVTFRNGLRKTLVFAGDSGAGKSETIAAMMEQQIDCQGEAAEVKKVDILAGDMLSLWRGEDGQVYAFGTEVGDFFRLTDITENWKAHFGDLLKKGAYSNLDYAKNPRVTIPGICDAQKLLAPTRINGFFYINNYFPATVSALSLADSRQVLKHVLVRGLRKNKGTSGDQPNLRAGLEYAGEGALVTRFRHDLDTALDWEERENDKGKIVTYLVFRDGSGDVFRAQEMVKQVFVGRTFSLANRQEIIREIEYDLVDNLFWLHCASRLRVPLDRAICDQMLEPLVGTFCGNPFVEPEGMDCILEYFAETFRHGRVHTGTIATQLARPGHEYTGPANAALSIIRFLLKNEEVNSRFQRNKNKVHQAMQKVFGGVLEAGCNLPVELEGYNLLLLEAHESRQVAFLGLDGGKFTLSTPLYQYQAVQGVSCKPFIPAIAVPERLEVIADIRANAEFDVDLSMFCADLTDYDRIRYWSSLEELAYQVLMVNRVIDIGSSDAEVARFPYEVRKACYIAELISSRRSPLAKQEVV